MSNNPTVNTVAKLLNITARRVQQLARDGIIAKPENGKYHLLSCFTGYIKYLQSRKYNLHKEDSDEKDLRSQLLKVQLIKAQMDIKKETGQLWLRSQAEEEWSNMILAFRSKMLAVPYRAACRVVGVKDRYEVQEIIRELVYEALDELSEYDLEIESVNEDSIEKHIEPNTKEEDL